MLFLSTDMVWQDVCSSILAVVWVASLTIPMFPLKGPRVILMVVPMMSLSRATRPRPPPPPAPLLWRLRQNRPQLQKTVIDQYC